MGTTYTITVEQNPKTGRWQYIVLDPQGQLYAQRKGIRTEAEAREEAEFEAEYATQPR